MAEKVTIMRLKVDLGCHKCYKKVKKILCKFPQIQDQVYDKKNNIVTIAVVCCNPEKLRDKICCKGCGTIKSIEIVEPPNPKPPVNPNPKPPVNPNPKPPVNPNPTPPVPVCPPTVPVCPPQPTPPPPVFVPTRVCCGPCYEGRPGGPCFDGYGGPLPCYDAYYGRPVYDSYGGSRACYVRRCDEYCCEENTSACTIM